MFQKMRLIEQCTNSPIQLKELNEIFSEIDKVQDQKHTACQVATVAKKRFMFTADDHCYLFQKELGHGSYKRVWHLVDLESKTEKAYQEPKTEEDYRRKGYRPRSAAEEAEIATRLYKQEVAIEEEASGLSGVVETEVYVDSTGKKHALQNVFSTDLFDHINTYIDNDRIMPAKEAKNLIRNTLIGLSSLHKKGITHYDIKPENILLKGKEQMSCITDLGLAEKQQITTQYKGTPGYMAPEFYVRNKKRDSQADVWAAGLVIFQIALAAWLIPVNPCRNAITKLTCLDNAQIKIKLTELGTQIDSDKHWLGNAREKNALLQLIKEMLHQNPKKRLSAQQALARFNKLRF